MLSIDDKLIKEAYIESADKLDEIAATSEEEQEEEENEESIKLKLSSPE
jgi:hypothetical protein